MDLFIHFPQRKKKKCHRRRHVMSFRLFVDVRVSSSSLAQFHGERFQDRASANHERKVRKKKRRNNKREKKKKRIRSSLSRTTQHTTRNKRIYYTRGHRITWAGYKSGQRIDSLFNWRHKASQHPSISSPFFFFHVILCSNRLVNPHIRGVIIIPFLLKGRSPH